MPVDPNTGDLPLPLLMQDAWYEVRCTDCEQVFNIAGQLLEAHEDAQGNACHGIAIILRPLPEI